MQVESKHFMNMVGINYKKEAYIISTYFLKYSLSKDFIFVILLKIILLIHTCGWSFDS